MESDLAQVQPPLPQQANDAQQTILDGILVAFLVATASGQDKSEPLFSISGDAAPYQITFSPDGKGVAVCSAYGQAHVFDLATRKPVSGAGHPKEIFSVQFDSSGDQLLTGSADTTMKL